MVYTNYSSQIVFNIAGENPTLVISVVEVKWSAGLYITAAYLKINIIEFYRLL